MTILKNIPLLKLNEKNLMNRFYDTAAGESIVAQATKRDNLFGEIYGGDELSATVNLNRASHEVTDVRIIDDHIVGTVTVLDTPMGKIMQELIDAKVQDVAFRPRLQCHMRYTDGVCYIYDINLITFDLVSDPA